MNDGANQIPILVKAMQVLEDLAGAPEASTAAALSRRLGIPGASCYRILQTYLTQGWVRQLPRGGHALGAGLLPLARAATGSDPLAPWYPVLDAFAERSGWTCKLSIRRGDQAVTVYRAEGSRPYSLAVRNGSTFPVLVGSSGAALLADSDGEGLEALIAAAPASVWQHQTPEQLRARVAEARAGAVLDRGSFRPEVVSCSLALRDAAGRVEAAASAIGLVGDCATGSLEQLAQDFSAALRTRTAQER